MKFIGPILFLAILLSMTACGESTVDNEAVQKDSLTVKLDE